VGKILDLSRTEIRHNSSWLGKLTAHQIVELTGRYRLARMLEREDFRSRLSAAQPISVHELLYPLFQAYDSVALQADVELGATEQKFNLLVCREIQREYGQPSEVAFTMPILVGLDGRRKMSKSLGNYVGIGEPPREMFGKLMSISDELMWSYYDLLTDFAERVVIRLKEEVRDGLLHPMEAKMQLAHSIVAGYHGEDAARAAREDFDRVFRGRESPTDAPERKIPRGQPRRLVALLVETGLAPSRSEAERLIKQGGVEIDGARVADIRQEIDCTNSGSLLLRAGKKKFLRILIE
jgi:tyrosyl-tRNA synthetase